MTEDQEKLLQDLLEIDGTGPKGRLSEWEITFIDSLDTHFRSRDKMLSSRQQVKLNDLGLKFDLGGVL